MGETQEKPPKPMSAASERMLKHFESKQFVGDYRSIGAKFLEFAKELAEELDSQNEAVGFQLQMGFQHMLEAQDCFARAKASTPG